ncbi:hypothetical protein ABE10_02330 [Bacillus toyonensis]|nr:hypothetical protein [Bacillus toyonensis]
MRPHSDPLVDVGDFDDQVAGADVVPDADLSGRDGPHAAVGDRPDLEGAVEVEPAGVGLDAVRLPEGEALPDGERVAQGGGDRVCRPWTVDEEHGGGGAGPPVECFFTGRVGVLLAVEARVVELDVDAPRPLRRETVIGERGRGDHTPPVDGRQRVLDPDDDLLCDERFDPCRHDPEGAEVPRHPEPRERRFPCFEERGESDLPVPAGPSDPFPADLWGGEHPGHVHEVEATAPVRVPVGGDRSEMDDRSSFHHAPRNSDLTP